MQFNLFPVSLWCLLDSLRRWDTLFDAQSALLFRLFKIELLFPLISSEAQVIISHASVIQKNK